MAKFLTDEEEMDYRRSLLRLAAKGNTGALQALEREYHVHVYSAAERARYIPTVKQAYLSAADQRKVETLLDSSGSWL